MKQIRGGYLTTRPRWIVLFLCLPAMLIGFDWGGESARRLSDATEVVLPVVGFASLFAGSDWAQNRRAQPLTIRGWESKAITKRDALIFGERMLRFGVAYIHVGFYKRWVRQRRPLYGRGDKLFDRPLSERPATMRVGPEYFSFPSSHASKMFFGAGTVQAYFGWKAALPFYTMAAGCSLIRLSRDNHFVHDLIAGALIGTKMALSKNMTNFLPTPLADGGAVEWTFQF